MNFNLLFLLLFFIVFSGCGVKAPPRKHTETIVDSYVKEYTGEQVLKDEEKKAEKKEDQSKVKSP